MASGYVKQDVFLTKKYTYKYSKLASGAYLGVTSSNLGITVPDGYRPFSFTQYNTGSPYVYPSAIYLTNIGSEDAVFHLRSRSDAATTATCSITVTYIRKDLVEDVHGKYSLEATPTQKDIFFFTYDMVNPAPLFVEPGTIYIHVPETLDGKTFNSFSVTYSDGTTGGGSGSGGWSEYIPFTMQEKGAVITAVYK